MRTRYRALTASIANPHRLETGNRIIKVLIVFFLGLLACACIFVCFLYCINPSRKLHETKEELALAQKKRDESRLYKEHKEKELEWLTTDFDYLELKVRDDMDLGKPGEIIINMKRSGQISSPTRAEEGRAPGVRPLGEGGITTERNN